MEVFSDEGTWRNCTGSMELICDTEFFSINSLWEHLVLGFLVLTCNYWPWNCRSHFYETTDISEKGWSLLVLWLTFFSFFFFFWPRNPDVMTFKLQMLGTHTSCQWQYQQQILAHNWTGFLELYYTGKIVSSLDGSLELLIFPHFLLPWY